MNYLRAWLAANYKQVTTAVLSFADFLILLKHPEWKYQVGAFAMLLGTFGIHLEPMVWSPEAINKRLGL